MSNANDPRFKDLLRQLRAAGDANRLRILLIISGRRKVCVSEVAEELGMSVAVISHHMRSLAKGGLVVPERHGKRICYIPKDNDLTKLIRKKI